MTTAPTAPSPHRQRLLPPGSPAATPAQLLAAREQRVERRRALQRRHPAATVVGASLVVPGPVKSSPRLATVRDEAVGAILRAAAAHGWAALEVVSTDAVTGPEALVAVTGDPRRVKAAMVDLEETCPLGRLWDLDVHDGDRPLGRAEIGRPPRRCLVCDRPAHACARSRAHPLGDLARAVEVLHDPARP